MKLNSHYVIEYSSSKNPNHSRPITCFFYWFIHISIGSFIHLSIHLSSYPTFQLSICSFIHLSFVCLPIQFLVSYYPFFPSQYVCLSVCLFFHLSICLTIHQWCGLSVCLFFHLSICLTIHQLCVSVSLSVLSSVCLPDHPSVVCLSVCLFFHLSVCLTSISCVICQSVCSFICPFAWPSISCVVCFTSVCMYVCLWILQS